MSHTPNAAPLPRSLSGARFLCSHILLITFVFFVAIRQVQGRAERHGEAHAGAREGARGGQRRASVQRGLCAFKKKVESMSVHMPAHACAHTRTSVRMSVPSPLCMPVCVLARMPVHMTARMSVHVAVRMAARVSGAHVGTSVYCFAGRPIRTHVYAQVSLHLHMAINI